MWLLVTVHSLVGTQVGLGFECFATGGTDEGSHVTVNQLVVFQGYFIFECLVTNVALEWAEVIFNAAEKIVLKGVHCLVCSILVRVLDNHNCRDKLTV